jgi:hypothetical protein
LPYHKIADGNRERKGISQWSGPAELLEAATAQYRKDRWENQPEIVEVWCEKDALSGVLLPVCNAWGATFVTVRGNPSLTIIYESAQEFLLLRKEQPPTILYIGDHDATGRSISDGLLKSFQEHIEYVNIERIALEPEQIAQHNLPTRLGKKTDSRHKAFAEKYGDASVEVDALPPNVLTAIVEGAIKQHVDMAQWKRDGIVERAERDSLARYMASLSDLGLDTSK